jgi:hypothetical protein
MKRRLTSPKSMSNIRSPAMKRPVVQQISASKKYFTPSVSVRRSKSVPELKKVVKKGASKKSIQRRERVFNDLISRYK